MPACKSTASASALRMEAEATPCPWTNHGSLCQNKITIANSRPSKINAVQLVTRVSGAGSVADYIVQFAAVSASSILSHAHDLQISAAALVHPCVADIQVTADFYDETQRKIEGWYGDREILSCSYELEIA